MSRLQDLDELFAQSPARRLCPEHATYDDAAERQRGGSPSAATGRRPSADKPPVPLPTARKLVRFGAPSQPYACSSCTVVVVVLISVLAISFSAVEHLARPGGVWLLQHGFRV